MFSLYKAGMTPQTLLVPTLLLYLTHVKRKSCFGFPNAKLFFKTTAGEQHDGDDWLQILERRTQLKKLVVVSPRGLDEVFSAFIP